MKRNFYLVMSIIRRQLRDLPPIDIINLIYPDSDVKSHLVDKIREYMHLYKDSYSAIFNFYESLDSQHQLIFDNWFNAQIELLDAKTIQHMV